MSDTGQDVPATLDRTKAEDYIGYGKKKEADREDAGCLGKLWGVAPHAGTNMISFISAIFAVLIIITFMVDICTGEKMVLFGDFFAIISAFFGILVGYLFGQKSK